MRIQSGSWLFAKLRLVYRSGSLISTHFRKYGQTVFSLISRQIQKKSPSQICLDLTFSVSILDNLRYTEKTCAMTD